MIRLAEQLANGGFGKSFLVEKEFCDRLWRLVNVVVLDKLFKAAFWLLVELSYSCFELSKTGVFELMGF